jgi:hypothetical protein
VVVTLLIAARAAHRHPAVRSMLLATASGIAFGMSSVFTKTVAVDWTGGVSAADVPSLAVIGALATAGMLLSQAAYRGAGLAAPLATLTVVNPVVAAAVGITMFGETFRYGTTGTVLALGCGVVAAGGLILLTTERLTHEHPDAVPARPAEAPSGTGARALPAEGPRRVPERAGRVPVRAGRGGLPEQVGEPASLDGIPEGVPAGAQAGLRGEDVLVRKSVATAAVLVPGPGAPTAVIVPRADETAGVRVPEPVAAAAVGVSGADTRAAVLVPGPQATAAVPVPGAPAAVLAPRPEETVDVLASEPVAAAAGAVAVPDTPAAVLVPGPGTAAGADGADASYEGGESSVVAASDDDRPFSYVPFYGIPYVPLPVIDRHRMRVRS